MLSIIPCDQSITIVPVDWSGWKTQTRAVALIFLMINPHDRIIKVLSSILPLFYEFNESFGPVRTSVVRLLLTSSLGNHHTPSGPSCPGLNNLLLQIH